MSKPGDNFSGWQLAELPEEKTNLRSPQDRNMLQFSPFAAVLEEGPPSSKGRFRRVMTTVSGTNGPRNLVTLTSRQLSQMSSTDSGETGTNSPLPNPNPGGASTSKELRAMGYGPRSKQGEMRWKESSTPNTSGNAAFSNSSTSSLDPTMLRGKLSTLRPGSSREASERELPSDMEPSQISANSKPETGEHDSSKSAASGSAEAGESVNPLLRRLTGGLVRKVSEDTTLIRKLSGLLSRSKPSTPTTCPADLMSKFDAAQNIGDVKAERRGADSSKNSRGFKVEKGIPPRKASLLGRFGRKDRTPQRKKSSPLSPTRAKGTTKSTWADGDVETAKCPAEKKSENEIDQKRELETELKGAGPVIGFENDTATAETGTEDDFAKRAVQIEKFLNSMAFL